MMSYCQPLGGDSGSVKKNKKTGCLKTFMTSPSKHLAPNSPDTMNFYIWGAVENNIYHTTCNIMEELIARIKLVFTCLKGYCDAYVLDNSRFFK